MKIKREYYREFACGYGAAVMSIGVTFPVNKVIFRQMLHGVGVRPAIAQLKNEGLLSLYRGVLPPLLQKSTSMALMFGTVETFYRYLCRHFNHSSQSVNYSFVWMSAAASSGCECILVPLERIQTLLQDPDYHSRFQNTFHAVKELHSYKLPEYYRGISIVYLRNFLSTGFFFSLREPIANKLLPYFQRHRSATTDTQQSSPGTSKLVPIAAAHFTSGSLLGASLSTIFYPLNVVRARMQSYVGGEFHSMFEIWKIIRSERSFVSMWKGGFLNFSRSLIYWGILNSSYELLKTVFFPSDHSNPEC